jgi:KDO2-lipid IV(A) lauroyltransferase
MKLFKYLFEFIIVIFFFAIFKIIGLKNSSNLGCLIFKSVGPILRKSKKIKKNIKIVFPDISADKENKIINEMWCNYGRVFSEYMHLQKFKKNKSNYIKINFEKFDELKKRKDPILFFSGHFANFELLSMEIEKYGFEVCALYRPLNNVFLNPIMEKLRIKHICKNQIPKSIPGKGRDGTRQLIKKINEKRNIALMVDQKVTEGIQVNLFKKKAHTLNIPAQLALKHGYLLVPLEIKREDKINFSISIKDPLKIDQDDDQYSITRKINFELEKMILNNPCQWIWTHDRWRL